jgi:signal transduction histidine kinase
MANSPRLGRPARPAAIATRERSAALAALGAGLAHELRNPLNAAHLQLSLVARRLRREPADPAAALQALALANDELARVDRLLEELLDLAGGGARAVLKSGT